jgi:hypothetical protein
MQKIKMPEWIIYCWEFLCNETPSASRYRKIKKGENTTLNKYFYFLILSIQMSVTHRTPKLYSDCELSLMTEPYMYMCQKTSQKYPHVI